MELVLSAGLLVLADVVVAMLASHLLCLNALACSTTLESTFCAPRVLL
jgi:hypothetical protein